jgi:hypothetical protein
MTDIRAYHPGTGHTVIVDSEVLDHHLRQSGWLSEAEHQENQAAAQAAAEKAAKTAKESK